jgi:hypothetical protein
MAILLLSLWSEHRGQEAQQQYGHEMLLGVTGVMGLRQRGGGAPDSTMRPN